MTPLFEELDYQRTPLGELALRRRNSPAVPDEWVYEVTLDHEMLMSSTVDASERALARLALDARRDRPLDVLVGGLGLGCTAAEALKFPNVRRLVVVELLAPVIDWHHGRLVPLAATLMDDSRCSLVADDFFTHIREADPKQTYDAILLDIDHSPEFWLHVRHRDFYSPAGLRRLMGRLRGGGVFALWSAWQPAADFLDLLGNVFASVQSHEVTFFNPHVNEEDTNWVIVAEPAERTAG
jgi:spermidine synthase